LQAVTDNSLHVASGQRPPVSGSHVTPSRLALPRVPPWLIVVAALLMASILGRFVADGRIKYGVVLVLVAGYGPLVFFDLASALALWVAVQFFDQLSALSYGPNGMGVLLALAWIGAFLTRTHPLRILRQQRRLLLTTLVFGLWITLTAAWARDPGAAGNEAAYWWFAALAFLIVVTTVTRPHDVRLIALAFVIGSVISVGIGLATGGLNTASAAVSQTAVQGRLTGGGGDPNQQAAGFVAAMFLIIGLFSVYRRRAVRVWLLIAFIVVAVGFIAAQSRGGLIALAVATIATLFLAPRQRRRIGGLAVLAGVAVIVLLATKPGAVQRLVDLGGGTSGRSDLWRVAWEVFKGHPLVGVGAGNFQVVESHYVLRPGSISRIQYIAQAPQVVHNTYLGLLTEEGVVGLLAYLAVVAGSLRASLLACRRFESVGRYDYADLTRAALMGTVGMLTALFFISDGDDLRLWVLLALGPVLLGVATRMAFGSDPATPVPPGSPTVATPRRRANR
jgi:O-antigen ligase